MASRVMIFWLQLCFFLCTFEIHLSSKLFLGLFLSFVCLCFASKRNNAMMKLVGSAFYGVCTLCHRMVYHFPSLFSKHKACGIDSRCTVLATNNKCIVDGPPRKVRTTTMSPSILNLRQWQKPSLTRHAVLFTW